MSRVPQQIQRLIAIVSLVLTTTAVSCMGYSEILGWKRFGSPKIGYFSIDYPVNWKAERFAEGYRGDTELIAVFYPPAPQLFPVVQVVRRAISASTLDDVASWGLERFTELNDDLADEYEVFPLQDILIDGHPATTREFIMDIETPLPLRRKDVYVARGDDMLIISLIATEDGFAEAARTFEHMITSFESLGDSAQ